MGYLISPTESADQTVSGDIQLQLVGQIGAGGMGTVWKTVVVKGLENPAEYVAAKFLRKKTSTETDASAPISSSVGMTERFRREQIVMSRLGVHPGFIKFLAGGRTIDGRLFFLTEYHPGISLEAHINDLCSKQDLLINGRHYGTEELKKPYLGEPLVSLKFAITVMLAILEALEYLHTIGLDDSGNPVTHRDLKPGNIMLVLKDGMPTLVKILDFGIAKVANHREAGLQTLTVERSIIGTLHCMAPEQVRADSVGPWTDVFAAGMVFLELLTGVRACASMGSVGKQLFYIVTHKFHDPGLYALGIPQALRNIVIKATQNDPSKRYKHGGEMLADLRKAAIQLFGADFLQSVEQTLYGVHVPPQPLRVSPLPVPAMPDPPSVRIPSDRSFPKSSRLRSVLLPTTVLILGFSFTYLIGSLVFGTNKQTASSVRESSDQVMNMDTPSSHQSNAPAVQPSGNIQTLQENPAYKLGKRLMGMENYSKAIESFSTALTTTKESSEIHERIATCYAKIGNAAKAKEHAALAQSLKAKKR